MPGHTVRHTLTLEQVCAGATLALDADDPAAPTLVVDPGMPCSVRTAKLSGHRLTYGAGAPRGEHELDHYAVLSQGAITVSRSADEATIKSAHRKLMVVHHPDKGGDPQKATAINKAFAVLRDPAQRRLYDNPPPTLEGSTGWAVRVSLESVAEREARGGAALHRVDWSQCENTGLSVAEAIEMVEKLGDAGIISGADDKAKDLQHEHAGGADLLLLKHITAEQALSGLDGEDVEVVLPSGDRCTLSSLAVDQCVLPNGYVDIIEGAGLPKHRDPAGTRGRLIVQYRVSSPEPAFAAKLRCAALARDELRNNALETDKAMCRLEAELQAERRAWKVKFDECLQEKQQLIGKSASQAELLQQQAVRIDELALAEVAAKKQAGAVRRQMQAAEASKGRFQSLWGTTPKDEPMEKANAICSTSSAAALLDTLNCVVTFTDGTRGSYGWVKHDDTSLRMTSGSSTIDGRDQQQPASGTQTTTHEAAVRQLDDQLRETKLKLKSVAASLAATDNELKAKDARLTELRAEHAQTQSTLKDALQEKHKDTEWGRSVLQLAMDSGLCPAELLSGLHIDGDTASYDVRLIRDQLLQSLRASIEQQAASSAQAKTELRRLSDEVHQRAGQLLSVPAARSEHPVSSFPDSCSGVSAAATLEHLDHAVASTLAEFERREKDEEVLREELAQQQQKVNDTMEEWQHAMRAGSELTSKTDPHVEPDSSYDECQDGAASGVLQAIQTLQDLRRTCARSVAGLEDLGNVLRSDGHKTAHKTATEPGLRGQLEQPELPAGEGPGGQMTPEEEIAHRASSPLGTSCADLEETDGEAEEDAPSPLPEGVAAGRRRSSHEYDIFATSGGSG
jgi:DnaJ-class molecular chaperone